MVKLYMTIGLPASGKTYWAERQDGLVIHSSDAIRAELGDVSDQSRNGEVFNLLHKRIIESLKNGESCIYDATNLSSKRRRAFLSMIDSLPCEKVAVVFAVSPDEIRRRNESRERKIPGDVIYRMLRQFQPPILDEGWDNIVLVNSPVSISENPLLMVRDIPQNNAHHSLTLLEHARAVCDYVGQYGGPLNAAAYYHDHGKFYTKEFRDSKGYPTTQAHYYGHENVGAYMYLINALRDYPNDIVAAGLIAWHMRPYVWDKQPHVKEKDRQWMSEEFIRQLELLHEADVEAHYICNNAEKIIIDRAGRIIL